MTGDIPNHANEWRSTFAKLSDDEWVLIKDLVAPYREKGVWTGHPTSIAVPQSTPFSMFPRPDASDPPYPRSSRTGTPCTGSTVNGPRTAPGSNSWPA